MRCVDARDSDLPAANKFAFAVTYVLRDHHAGRSFSVKLYTHADDVVEACRLQEIDVRLRDYEHDVEFASECLLRETQAA